MNRAVIKQAKLVLEDGRVFTGESFGADGERTGEVVFNTSLTGYQEVLTDPSYKGQIVAMTCPLIGNYGVNEKDVESRRLWLEGFVVRELSGTVSNYRAQSDLATYLRENGVIGIQGVDTRALTRHIREAGAMKAIISTVDDNDTSLLAKVATAPGLVGRDLVREVSCQEPYECVTGGTLRVVVLDCGVKYSILRQLRGAGCDIVVVPAWTTTEDIIARDPDGLLISNGPGDPEPVKYAIDTIRDFLSRKTIPVFGICLGQQLIGLALGGKTYKLKFGHHGANHPVKDLATGRIDITVQNHGFCVDFDSMGDATVDLTHVNLNDGTCEGMRHRRYPVFSVQFHPEAGPGPHDAHHLFDRFVNLMREYKTANDTVKPVAGSGNRNKR